jgi:hypothetical protein
MWTFLTKNFSLFAFFPSSFILCLCNLCQFW